METDEYEISIGREIALCRKMIARLQKAIHKRERQHGRTTESVLLALERDQAIERNTDFSKWRKDYQELQTWRARLIEYEKALRMLKGS